MMPPAPPGMPPAPPQSQDIRPQDDDIYGSSNLFKKPAGGDWRARKTSRLDSLAGDSLFGAGVEEKGPPGTTALG